MNSPLISIIVPNFNHAKYLKCRLDSIFNQTYKNFEVILLDDASKDDSMAILEKYKDHPKVSCLIKNKINSGSPFKQWEKGLKLIKGEYVWIAETDDYCDIDFLEKQLKCLIEEKGEVAVAKTLTVTENSLILYEIEHPIFKKENSVFLTSKMFLTSPIKNVSCIVFKKELLSLNREYFFKNYSIMGDQVFYWEFFNNKKFLFNNDTVSYFRKLNSSVSNSNSEKGMGHFNKYYSEHIEFLKLIKKEIEQPDIDKYIKKHFNKVKNNLKKNKKISFQYIWLILKHNTIDKYFI